MKPHDLLCDYIDPAMVLLGSLTKVQTPNEALVLVIAIAGQESGWKYRKQLYGTAQSYWQFERNGGVAELFQKTSSELRAICDNLDINYEIDTVFEAMRWNDILAACMARLLLWQDAEPLPAVGDVNGGWAYYQRNWRPGAPRPNDWPGMYKTAMESL